MKVFTELSEHPHSRIAWLVFYEIPANSLGVAPVISQMRKTSAQDQPPSLSRLFKVGLVIPSAFAKTSRVFPLLSSQAPSFSFTESIVSPPFHLSSQVRNCEPYIHSSTQLRICKGVFR